MWLFVLYLCIIVDCLKGLTCFSNADFDIILVIVLISMLFLTI